MTSGLKYHAEIEELLGRGASLPDMFSPDNKEAYRWAFDEPHENNHLPAYKISPQRILPGGNGNLNTSGFALSCFDTLEASKTRFAAFSKSNPNFHKTVGNSVVFGFLNDEDGLITESNNNLHFDLYESVSCDLSSKFTVAEKLV